jgi:hypothetical protein
MPVYCAEAKSLCYTLRTVKFQRGGGERSGNTNQCCCEDVRILWALFDQPSKSLFLLIFFLFLFCFLSIVTGSWGGVGLSNI